MPKKALTKAKPASKDRTAQLMKSAKPLEKWLHIGTIDSEVEWHDVGEAYTQVSRLLEDTEADRKDITRELDDGKKKVMARYRPLTDFYGKVKTHLAGLARRYNEHHKAKYMIQVERQAKAAEKRGEKDFALALRQNAAMESVAPENPHIKFTTVWKGAVSDMEVLLRGILDGSVPQEVISINQTQLNQMARRYREDLPERFPGLKVVIESNPRRR